MDENGFEIEPVIVSIYDENGNLNKIPPNLVPPNQGGLYKPKWNYDLKVWEEGDPERALAETKNRLIGQYHLECIGMIEKGFEHNGDFFRFLKDPDQDNFTQTLVVCVASILMGMPTQMKPIEWKTENNGVKLFTMEEFFAICQSGQVHKSSLMSAKWQLEDYIQNDVHDLETLNSLGDFESAKNIVLK